MFARKRSKLSRVRFLKGFESLENKSLLAADVGLSLSELAEATSELDEYQTNAIDEYQTNAIDEYQTNAIDEYQTNADTVGG